jgi:hypothetical protein
MGIREDIMALHDNHPGDSFDTGKNLGLEIAATLAEAREKELLEEIRVTENNLADSMSTTKRLMDKCDKLLAEILSLKQQNSYMDDGCAGLEQNIISLKAERAQMIAELRGLSKWDWIIVDGVFNVTSNDLGVYMEADRVQAIINKYEAL